MTHIARYCQQKCFRKNPGNMMNMTVVFPFQKGFPFHKGFPFLGQDRKTNISL